LGGCKKPEMIMSEQLGKQVNPFQEVLDLIERQVPTHEHGNFIKEVHSVLKARREEELQEARANTETKERLFYGIRDAFESVNCAVLSKY
jgi:hypothetical protein